MTLSDLANLGTFVGAVAVLVSLVYLAVQVRQTEKNQRALMNQGVATRATEIVRWNAEPHIAALRVRVLQGETDFAATELIQLSYLLRVSAIALQDSYLQYTHGLTDNATFETTQGGTRGLLAQRVFRTLWLRMRGDFSPETAALIDAMIAAIPPAEPLDVVARFRADLERADASAPPEQPLDV